MSSPRDLHWEDFSVISATYSVEDPGFHRVTPDHFRNMQLTCQSMSKLGYKRIGLIISRDISQKVQHHWAGAMAAYQFSRHNMILSRAIHSISNQEQLINWYRQYKPDAIISENHWSACYTAELLDLPIPGPITFAIASLHGTHQQEFMGIDELPPEVGAAAAERLARMIAQGEKGLPRIPSVTMVEGVWRELPGNSSSGVHAKATSHG